MAPVVHGLEAEYAGQITFSYLDIDDSATDDFKAQLGYSRQPQYFLLDGDGNIVQEWGGTVPEADFVSAFDAILAESS